jgi:hypothetical protein
MTARIATARRRARGTLARQLLRGQGCHTPLRRRAAGFRLAVEEQITGKPERSESAAVALCAWDKLWRIATLHLLCGLPGSGKSTLARRLEQDGAGLRLSPDDWMLALGFQLYDEAARARVEQLQWALAQHLLANGVSVILESGF